MVEFQAVWVSRAADGEENFAVWPVLEERGLVITNQPDAFDGLLPEGAADIMSLYDLAHATGQRATLEQLLPPGATGAEALWQLWLMVSEKLRQLPPWVLEHSARFYGYLGAGGMVVVLEQLYREQCAAAAQPLNWLDSFKADVRWGEKRTLPQQSDCAPLDIAQLTAHIAQDGALSHLMTGYEVRSGQIEMLQAVAEAFNQGRHLLVEAGTGVGKSLAYLLPALGWAQLNDLPVVISTNTRNLQSQLIEKDVPLLLQALQGGLEGAPARVALIKGRANYLCLRQFALLLEQGIFELERPELRLFAEALAWAALTPDGDLDSFAGAGHADGEFLAKLGSNAEECRGRGCRFARRCFMQRARSRAMQAHLVIANHALVFSEAASPGSALPPYNQIIFDEAHNLEEVATRQLSVELSTLRLRQLLRRLSRGRGSRSGGALELLHNALKKGSLQISQEEGRLLRRQIRQIKELMVESQHSAARLFELLYGLIGSERLPVRFRTVALPGDAASAGVVEEMDAPVEARSEAPGVMREVCRAKQFVPCAAGWDEQLLCQAGAETRELLLELIKGLEKLVAMVREYGSADLFICHEQVATIDGILMLLRTFVSDLDFVLAASDDRHLFWAEPVMRSAGAVKLFAAPLSIAETLENLLYGNKASVIFCSATLRVGSSFSFMGRRLGTDLIDPSRLRTCVAQSPFDYLRQCATLVPTFLPVPTGESGGGYVEQLAALMQELFVRTAGRALVLFTSYEMLNQVARLLTEPLQQAGIQLLVQGSSGTRDQITHLFRSDRRFVLFGAQSFWEGVDVAGVALSCVVMARLPFAAIKDPIIEARCEQIDNAGGSSFREFLLPQAVIRFRQGFGRLIRSRSDRGVVIIADARIVLKNYGSTFRKSLPCPLQRVTSPGELLERLDELLTPDRG